VGEYEVLKESMEEFKKQLNEKEIRQLIEVGKES